MAEAQVVACPHCGQAYQLSPEHVAAYAGTGFPCGRCQKQVPVLAAPLAPPVSSAAGAPYAVAAGQAAPTLGYATPVQYQGQFAGALWREGALLVVAKGAALPPACVKCGVPMQNVLHKKIGWHNPFVYLLLLAGGPGVIIYIIVATVTRKTIVLDIPLCATHRAKRRNFIIAGWLAALLGIGAIAAEIAVGGGRNSDTLAFAIIGGIVFIFTGILVGLLGARVLTPTKIDAHYAWLKGAGPQFMERLPTNYAPVV